MKKILVIAAIALAVLVGGAFLYFKGKRYEIQISQAQIDEALEKQSRRRNSGSSSPSPIPIQR